MPTSYLRHYWSDNAGLIRAKVQANGDKLSTGVGIAYAEQAQCAMQRNLALDANIGAVGDLKLIPDPTSYVQIPYREKTYRVLGDMYEDGSPWPLCPRHFLKKAVSDASALGYEIQAAFEPEFYLLYNEAETSKPIDQGLYSEASHLDDLAEWMDLNLTSLEAQNVLPEGFHHEAGPGQYEISIRHASPVKSADDILTLRDTIKAISKDSGFTATFCPKPFFVQPGNGLHLNLSLWQNGRPCMASPEDPQTISNVGAHFISGLPDGIDAAVAMTCPTLNSHRRLLPANWAGAEPYWNYADREAVIRVPRSGNHPITHIEFRALDSTANPYLALGSIIHLGLNGILRQSGPVAPKEVVGRLPNFERSMKALSEHEVLTQKLGLGLLRAYQAVRISDYQCASTLGETEESNAFITKY